MRAVQLYIAASLDGYIADADGGVAWLDDFAAPEEGDYGYAAFYAGVEAVCMGRHTYEQVLTFGPWPYAGKKTFVFTHHPPAEAPEGVAFVSGSPREVLAAHGPTFEGDLWLVGGGRLIQSFAEEGLIDTLILTIIPVLLGRGVPLFLAHQARTPLRLEASEAHPSGLVQLRYAVPNLPPLSADV